MKAKHKRIIGTVVSILVHSLLALFFIRVFDQDRYRPTSTKGYTIDLIKEEAQPNPQKTSPDQTPMTSGGANSGNPDQILNTKEQINFKDNSEELAKQAAAKAAAAKEALLKKESREAKLKEEREARRKAALEAKKDIQSKEKALKEAQQQAQQVKDTIPAPKTPDQLGQEKNDTPPKQIIVPHASAPTTAENTPGSGDAENSSTNGDGNQSAEFDFRVIEYGREAAYAINQNIVIPDAYKYTHVTYRAFVTLDRNMQFQKMQMVQSTGNAEFDSNIAKALQQTVYPPLPSGANWNQYKNIDFTIH